MIGQNTGTLATRDCFFRVFKRDWVDAVEAVDMEVAAVWHSGMLVDLGTRWGKKRMVRHAGRILGRRNVIKRSVGCVKVASALDERPREVPV